ncbi:DNA helicase MCM8 [Rhipicephalus sanguineus]|uniref:DNA helicase MCM8 n=1 Tax=Rhipicephalus sanguineus TaxID=34632 RepID=UPI001893ECE5|nr:DNA helicase MCM8 [Rhipicephalus sanguineus]
MNYNSWNNRGRGRFRRRAAGPRFARQRRRIVDPEDSDGSQVDDRAASSSPRFGNDSHRRRISAQQSPYPGWHFYFPNEDYPPDESVSQRLKLLEACFAERVSKFVAPTGVVDRSRSSYEVRVDEIADDAGVKEDWPDLKESLKCRPHDVLKLLGLALHQTLSKHDQSQMDIDAVDPLPELTVRIAGFGPLTPLRDVRSMTCGRMVAVRGTVVRASEVKPQYRAIGFTCSGCGTEQSVAQPGGYFTVPTCCPERGCRSRTFQEQATSPLTQLVDWQSLRLQESDEGTEGGRIPRIIDCELTDDLVGSAVPGDMVTVAGIVELARCDGPSSSTGPLDCYLVANHVLGEQREPVITTTPSGPDLGRQDYYAIEAIHDKPDLFRLLVNSLCPAIYGHEIVKAGLLLALFGGVRRYSDDPDHVPVRGDPHVLVVGDPGLGKSQLLHACARVAPRGVFVCGNTASIAGLTVSVGRGSAGEASLEAGALVLADRGCCCIDELDKMSTAQGALLEAMEQQCVSIAKAELTVSLPARAGVLAAANPVGGHYNRAKTVAENLRMGSALLSRFDLVFILLDQPNADLDRRLSEHVMAMHLKKSSSLSSCQLLLEGASDTRASTTSQTPQPSNSLAQRLRGPVPDPIPAPLLRKYITYARQYVQPTLSSECAAHLQKFYLHLRGIRQADSVPITTRQLESLIRLTQARARLELREECTAQDALDVIELMKHSIADTQSDGMGSVDFRRSQHGSGMSKPAQARALVSALTKESQRTGNRIFTTSELRTVAEQRCGILSSSVRVIVDALNDQGFLLKKGSGRYQLQTTDF